MTDPILQVKDLNVSFPSEAGVVNAVRGISFNLMPGKTLGIVGESGSGKSVTSLAIMGLLPDYAKVSGSVKLGGNELLGLTDDQLCRFRGKEIGMIFQDPLSSLTPVFTVGDQIVEALQLHQGMNKAQAWERAVELLDLVGIPNPKVRAKSFPHEFSGGMRQRVVIAISIANNPKVIIADEPTTALDVTIQAQILEVLKTAQRETSAAVIMITHDMGVVANIADDVVVMYAGRPVETGGVDEIFHQPQMPYTVGLLSAIPRPDVSSEQPLTPIEGNPPILIDLPDRCPFAARCSIKEKRCLEQEPKLLTLHSSSNVMDHRAACWRANEIEDGKLAGKELFETPPIPEDAFANSPREERPTVLSIDNMAKHFPLLKGAILKRRVGTVYAVDGISFDIRRGETLAIVGESGCGKTSALLEIMSMGAGRGHLGTMQLHGADVGQMSARQRRAARSNIQMVFQDPMGALDPRLTVYDIISEPLKAFDFKGNIPARVRELMDLVGLDPAHVNRFPGAFSGGQRQRIGIARALASEPSIIVLDEPVSALDVSIQAGVINLLDELRAKLGLSFLFVAHDLSVVRHISHRVAVMYLGKFVEIGDVDEVFDNPRHPYTKALLSAIPIPDPQKERTRERILLKGDLPSPTQKPQGCSFVTRCPLFSGLPAEKQQKCQGEVPQMSSKGGSLSLAACHYQ